MKDNNSFLDSRVHRYELFIPTREDPTLVVCPCCQNKAKVLPLNDSNGGMRLSCERCGCAKEQKKSSTSFYWGDEMPTDGYFKLPLWMQVRCCGKILWAFNLRHLDLLESYVGARLRERRKDPKSGWRNASVVSRLPNWIKASGNRDKILQCLKKLRKLADAKS